LATTPPPHKENSPPRRHDDIDLAELFDRLRDRLVNFLRLSNISSNGNRFPTIVINRIRSRLKMVQLATDERHCRTRFPQAHARLHR
jgi:hypothetical protein